METQKSIELTVEEAENLRKTCNEKIELAKAINRLFDNKDFKLLFSSYTKNEAERLVGLLADPRFNLNKDVDLHRKDINEQMIGISRFAYYCNFTIPHQARVAESTLYELNTATING